MTGRRLNVQADGAAESPVGPGDPSISAFTFRCQVPAGPDDDEDDATLAALELLDRRGYPHQVLRSGVTDLREVTIRPRR
ncbi:DUF6204 family protein [Micromonospora zhanjiangensis]|uniref:DUF6204 family protein n=1 Tax=Micromonospora zhanjiangensis TaxID=1522057 RepID=A0ABV8KVE2_9ACTN